MKLLNVNKAEQRIRDTLGHSSICACVSKHRGRYITTARKCTCYANNKEEEEKDMATHTGQQFIKLYANQITIVDTFDIISKIPDNFFHAIITDPPYDLNQEQKEFLQDQFLRICKGVVIVFSPPKNQWILPADQYNFWVKQPSTKNTSKNYSRFVEMIFIYGRNRWNYKRHWSNYINVHTDKVDTVKNHPFRKPPSLIERLILNHTNEDDWIFDPFTGSGLVCKLAYKLERYAIGLEKEEKYYENIRYPKDFYPNIPL